MKTSQMLQRACLDLQQWKPSSCEPFTVSVNVSALQLMSPNFCETVAATLTATGTDPASVTLEVTETSFIHDSNRALVVLDELKTLGVRLALDDFGTGYPSLSYLMRFPVDVVKIDQVFIGELDERPSTQPIVQAVVTLAHELGMAIVAEGVETGRQFHTVGDLGGDSCQGFYFARPMSARHVAALL